MDSLASDLIEIILSHLPLPCIIRASSVCKSWNSIIRSDHFKSRIPSNSKTMPWLFICRHRQKSTFSVKNLAFAFIPEFQKWVSLPYSTRLFEQSFTASHGFEFFYTMSYDKFSFRPDFCQTWHETGPVKSISHCEHLIGNQDSRLVLLGADGHDFLAVNIYDPRLNSWELCNPPPNIFGRGFDSNLLCPVLFHDKFYLYITHMGYISSMNLETRSWTDERTLRPPGLEFGYLISCDDQLVLAGLCRVNNEPEFSLWKINERTYEFSEIGVMPEDLRSCFFENEGEQFFPNLSCVGLGNVVYVLSEGHDWNRPACVRPACVCTIDSSTGKCSWRRIPDLPESARCIRSVSSFCCSVSVQDILGNQGST